MTTSDDPIDLSHSELTSTRNDPEDQGGTGRGRALCTGAGTVQLIGGEISSRRGTSIGRPRGLCLSKFSDPDGRCLNPQIRLLLATTAEAECLSTWGITLSGFSNG